MRHTRAHTGNRRSHHALTSSAFSICAHCKASKIPHTVCSSCGYYRGRKVLDIVKGAERKMGRKVASKK